jgi:Leucine Rich repeat
VHLQTNAGKINSRHESWRELRQPRIFKLERLLMAQLLLRLITDDLRTLLLTHWLDVRTLAILDVAVSSKTSRPYWMKYLRSMRSTAIDNMDHSASSLMWLISRGIVVSRLQMKADSWEVRRCDLSLLNTIDLMHLGLNGSRSVTDDCILKTVNIWSRIRESEVNYSSEVTAAGESAWRHGCDQLQSINLQDCSLVTDAGVSLLGHGCGQLQHINLRGCGEVTDAGVSALGQGCSQLQSINLEGCEKVTDIGISALGYGCGQLQHINLRGCGEVTDAGVSALGQGCGQLQSINLEGCEKVTDIGISALGYGCGQLQHANLRGCGKVTNAGLSALGQGCRTLPSINVQKSEHRQTLNQDGSATRLRLLIQQLQQQLLDEDIAFGDDVHA